MNPSPRSPSRTLVELEAEHRRLRDYARDYRQAEAVLDEMIEYVTRNATSFDEADDRIRIYESRKWMLRYHASRSEPTEELSSYFLRKAASTNIPSACDQSPCRDFIPADCVARARFLSWRQRKMCIERLNQVTNALKIEAAVAAGHFRIEIALQKRREACDVQVELLQLDPVPAREVHLRYLDYWRCVTEMSVALQDGDFAAALRWQNELAKTADTLDARTFPNYFVDPSEARSYDLFIFGVKAFAERDFVAAEGHFRRWLALRHQSADKAQRRYDNIRIAEFACRLVVAWRAGDWNRADTTWIELHDFLDQAYIARPTWVLLDRLGLARRLSRAPEGGHADQRALPFAELAGSWRYLLPDVVVLAEDKSVPYVPSLPSIITACELVDADSPLWAPLFQQNIKNAILLIVDYENRRQHEQLPGRRLHALEQLSVDELFVLVGELLGRRSKYWRRSRWLDSREHLNRALAAIASGNYRGAQAAMRSFFEFCGSWPHLIRVMSQQEITNSRPELAGEFMVHETQVRRLWDRQPNALALEGMQDLRPESYYYLRPRWNGRMAARYRLRHETFLQSPVPRALDTFAQNMLGARHVDAARFGDWILQFDPEERLLACQLLSMLTYVDGAAIRQLWRHIYTSALPRAARSSDLVFAGLGHAAKSGPLHTYYFKQAISALPTEERPFAKDVFRPLGGVIGAQPEVVVLLDDFVGTGDQAIKQLTTLLEQVPWLHRCEVYYFVLVAMTNGLAELNTFLGEIRARVHAGVVLEEDARAFSVRSPCWDDVGAAAEAEEWARGIGKQLLVGRDGYDPDRDALGWKNSRVLVAFEHNVPNNTLPLMWADGYRNGRRWKPLLDRFD